MILIKKDGNEEGWGCLLLVMDSTFTRSDIVCAEDLPHMIEIECPICFDIMFTDPHLTTCCGRHFCGRCTKQAKDSKRGCPMCRERNFQAFIDKNRHRIIIGLDVYCVNRNSGCNWKGALKDLPHHVKRGERHGDCPMELVKCCNSTASSNLFNSLFGQRESCDVKRQRYAMERHEQEECLYRNFMCPYCDFSETYKVVTELHYKTCSRYPIPCPNSCSQDTFTTQSIKSHLDRDCPLQPVYCQFNWAGCRMKVYRQDLPQHLSDSLMDHMIMLAMSCKKLRNENEELKKECALMREALKKKGILKT